MSCSKPITARCCFSIPPENIRVPLDFDVFRGYRKVTPDCNGLKTIALKYWKKRMTKKIDFSETVLVLSRWNFPNFQEFHNHDTIIFLSVSITNCNVEQKFEN